MTFRTARSAIASPRLARRAAQMRHEHDLLERQQRLREPPARCSKTSSAAPAISRSFSAHARAASSTTGPRAVLTRYAVRFMRASALLVDQMPRLGRQRHVQATMSDVASSWSSDIGSRARPVDLAGGCDTATLHAEGPARAATARPMRPTPTMPSCLPRAGAEHEVERPARPLAATRRAARPRRAAASPRESAPT